MELKLPVAHMWKNPIEGIIEHITACWACKAIL